MPSLNPPRPISSEDETSAFDCGKSPLDDFFKRHALAKGDAMLSRTYVVTDGPRVVGYYTLALLTIHPDETPKKLGRGMPNAIPSPVAPRRLFLSYKTLRAIFAPDL